MPVNEVNIYNDENYDLDQFPDLALTIFNKTLQKTKNNDITSEIAVVFIDENKSLALNKQYRKRDYVADVLSFGNDLDNFAKDLNLDDLGDVFICYPKAKQQSLEYDHSLTRELSFLFLHGLLHNLGYDHETKIDEKIMFGLQKEILSELKILRN